MFEALLGSLFVTILSSIVLFIFFRHKVLWWEIIILLFISLLVGASFKWIATSHLSKDIEYWNTKFSRIEYYEKWDEWIQDTCSETTCDDDNNCTTTTYDCSYKRTHYPRYTKIDHLGREYSSNKEEYLRLKSKMDNSHFVDMNRDYYRTDGNMYYTTYSGRIEDFECIVSKSRYINKPQTVPNIFQYIKVDDYDIKEYGLFDYPNINSRNYQRHLLGYNDPSAEHKLQILNGELGHIKEVKVFIIVFKNQPMTAGNLQESYWRGGNKNEVIITINIDDNNKPTWCLPFSWSDRELFKLNIRNYVMDQNELNLSDIVDFSHREIESGYERKKFRDFDYLELELTTTQLIWLIIISIIVNVLVSLFIVVNEWEENIN